MKKKKARATEVRTAAREFDEFVATGAIHVEVMNDNHVWIGVRDQRGTCWHLNLSTKSQKIRVLVEQTSARRSQGRV